MSHGVVDPAAILRPRSPREPPLTPRMGQYSLYYDLVSLNKHKTKKIFKLRFHLIDSIFEKYLEFLGKIYNNFHGKIYNHFHGKICNKNFTGHKSIIACLVSSPVSSLV